MTIRGAFTLATLLTMFPAVPILANTTEIPELPRIDETVAIDGRLDDKAWRNALKIEVDTETRPGGNTPAKVKTVAYLVEDGRSLFVAFDARDPDPDKIRAYFRDRDSGCNDDFVGIIIDSRNDQRRVFEFFANALGSQMDMTQDDVNQREVDARSRDVGRQLLYSHKLNPQTGFFPGFSDRHIDDDDLDRLTLADRTYFLNIGYTWSP